MTVSTEISSNEYTGNGVTTDFDYKFRIFKANQLSVITSDADGDNVVTLRLGTDYTVTGANKSAGGKVILTKPLANGHKISIARDIPITQETSFRNQSKFLAETHEDAFDYLTMILQRIWGSLGSLYLKRPSILANWFDAKGYRIANLGKPKRDSDAVDLGTLKDEIEGVNSTILKKEKRTLRVDDMDIAVLPKSSERAGNVLTFDEEGNPIVVVPASGSAVDVLNQLAKDDSQVVIAGEKASDIAESSKVPPLLSQFPHVKKYINDNDKLRGILSGKVCSFEGEPLSITEQIVISGNKHIDINTTTELSITSKIDTPIVFTDKIEMGGNGRLIVNVNNNDREDGKGSALLFLKDLPDLHNVDVFNTNGASILIGRENFDTNTHTGTGSGYIFNHRAFNCGKGIHSYVKDLKGSIIIENCTTDELCGSKGNTYYLSGHDVAKAIGGHFKGVGTSSPNINKGASGFVVGGLYETYRGPTLGENIEFGSITGGGVSKGCGFSAISTDIRRNDGTYPISDLLVDGWQAIGCNRTMYVQAQNVKFGNIHTIGSTSIDSIFRINGASPGAAKQIGVITVFSSVSSPKIFTAANGSKMIIQRDLIFHDFPLSSDTLISASDGNSVINKNDIIHAKSDLLVPNLLDTAAIDLSEISSVLTIRLPASTYSNTSNIEMSFYVHGGNGSKRARFQVAKSMGTINNSTNYIDVVPAAGEVKLVKVISITNGNYLLSN
ncbi:hypothetical protein [Providencia sp. PROV032]|uniref:hypothetical protein n=1 Tax=Providencia sp. PROV032 TaxID=2949764 RepID=UPI00234AEAF9|nr:hypothetical protein [Providencia sp. PROV032]